MKHEFKGVRCFFATHALAGVFTAANLAKVLFEPFTTAKSSACHVRSSRLNQCSVAQRAWR